MKNNNRQGPRTRAEARKPKLDFNQAFSLYRSKEEEQRE